MTNAKDAATQTASLSAPGPLPKPTPIDQVVTTRHKAKIGGKALTYTANCGTWVLKEEAVKDGEQQADNSRASMFFTAYTLDGVKDKATRPITFCFNGGPGSSSVWVHLGVFGPKRVKLDKQGNAGGPPYQLIDNEFSLLADTDLVFIDPIGTGYSRMSQGEKAKEFHDYQRDLDSVGEFIRLYCTREHRWASPKFIAGESYGTTRACGLAGHLQEKYGMYFNGLLLISVALDFQTLRFDIGNDLPPTLFLPTYAATAWFHKKLAPDLQKRSLKQLLDEVQTFACGEYCAALFAGSSITAAHETDIVAKIARYTGLTQAYVRSTKLRINIHRFCKQLLRDQAKTVGRLDSRFTATDRDSAGEHYEFDPAHAAIGGVFAACINDYLRRELKYENDLPYNVLSGLYLNWGWNENSNRYVTVSETLRKAMSMNPHLKVYVGNGYYDFATPHFASDYTFNHLALDESLTKNISTHYYEAGHMMYIHHDSLKRMTSDMSEFVRQAAKPT